MNAQQLIPQIDQLPIADQWQIVNHILHSLQHTLSTPNDWQATLAQYDGIFADDPIERPTQLSLEQREAIE